MRDDEQDRAEQLPQLGQSEQPAEVLQTQHLPERRSIMRELLGDDADRYEVAPGRWYLPGTPP